MFMYLCEYVIFVFLVLIDVYVLYALPVLMSKVCACVSCVSLLELEFEECLILYTLFIYAYS